MSFLIVSGLSGSGKTIALQALEDAGFYCIDNLPAALLPHFAREVLDPKQENGLANVAVGIDARNRAFLAELPENLKRLKELGIQCRIIFLEAEEPILVRRFQGTRRKHPMIDDRTSLLEAIHVEKSLLEPLAFASSLRIDTSHTTPRPGPRRAYYSFRVLRLQARHAAGCRLRLRCTLFAQSVLANRSAPLHGARRASGTVHGAV
jgi:UPF0042 nucleotide-binding protein